jgi:3-deoxy-7-phosphoheptulonate synthase
MQPINNVHVTSTMPLLPPDVLKAELPVTDEAADLVFSARESVRKIIRGEDSRVLAVVGPCSIHDPAAALDYARQLRAFAGGVSDALLVVMRVYFEKPRTTVGWKGLINDPHLNNSFDIPTGLRVGRRLLLDVAHLGLPAATEMLDTILPQYLAELVSWTAIGARTTESQTHREMASGLSMPVGFKNGTDGGYEVAVNAIVSASRPHRFLGVDGLGQVSIVQTTGNPDGHMVLRGGAGGPNYDEAAVDRAVASLRKAGIAPRIVVDCSHDNSGKNHERQPEVMESIARQVRTRQSPIVGVMIESNLVGGRQNLGEDHQQLVYGQSITDACVDLDTTFRMLTSLAESVRKVRAAA